MDINVKNVDLAYDQCENLHKTMDMRGSVLMSELKSNITNLKVHWISSDASAHINNLIDLHTFLGNVIVDSVNSISYAADRIISIQNVRKANHGGSGNVGTHLSTRTDFDKLSHIENTAEYQASYGELTSDLNDLKSIQASYMQLISTFKNQRDELFNNWLAGANIERARQVFNDFLDNSDKYKNYLDSAIENLSKATSNISFIS